MAVLFKKVFLQTAAVYADANRNMVRLAAVGDGFYPAFSPNISGVDADFGSAVFRCLDGEPVVKVNVGNKRQGRSVADFAESFRGLHIRHGQPRNFAPCRGQLANLPERALYIGRFCIEHRLNGNGCAASDFDLADGNLFCHLYHTSM